jgi:triosephosphate isomerase
MRVPFIAGNWKMNTTFDEAVNLVEQMKSGLEKYKSVEKVVCPPFISLHAVKEHLTGTSIKMGAQDLFYIEKGAYTGEISPLMLTGLCDYVIIGHSERRQYFQETDETINRKLVAALKTGIIPILCVGEQLVEKESGQTETVIERQITGALAGTGKKPLLVIAYEPVWAIGTGRAATGEQANRTITFIRQKLAEKYGLKYAEDIRILYGGSVTPENTAEIMSQPDIDGGLVGGASLKADQFVDIVRQTAKIKRI